MQIYAKWKLQIVGNNRKKMKYAPQAVRINKAGGDLNIKFLSPANCQFRYGIALRNSSENYVFFETNGHLSPLGDANNSYAGISPKKLVGGKVLVGFVINKLTPGPKGMQIEFTQDLRASIVTVTVDDDDEAVYLKVLVNMV